LLWRILAFIVMMDDGDVSKLKLCVIGGCS
jgi:hypothetical protein